MKQQHLNSYNIGNSFNLSLFKHNWERPPPRGSAQTSGTQKVDVCTCKLLVETGPLRRSEGEHDGDTALHLLCDAILHDKDIRCVKMVQPRRILSRGSPTQCSCFTYNASAHSTNYDVVSTWLLHALGGFKNLHVSCVSVMLGLLWWSRTKLGVSRRYTCSPPHPCQICRLNELMLIKRKAPLASTDDFLKK